MPVDGVQDALPVRGVREAPDPDEGVLVALHGERSHHVHPHLLMQRDDGLVHVAGQFRPVAREGAFRTYLVEHAVVSFAWSAPAVRMDAGCRQDGCRLSSGRTSAAG